MAASPFHSQRPTSGQICDVPFAFLGVLIEAMKLKSGYITPTFSGAHKWVELLRKPYILRLSTEKATRSKVGTSCPTSRGPKRGQNYYVHLAFWVIANKENKLNRGYITCAFLRAQK